MSDWKIISADSHLEVSPDQWRGYVDAEFREWVPKVVPLDGGGEAWEVPGSGKVVPLGLNFAAGMSRKDIKPRGISYSDNPAGSGNGEQRLREMDTDGVYADVLFPAVSGQRSLGNKMPPEAYIAVVRGYNDWLSQEYTAADYDRLWGVGILPTTGVADAIDEYQRLADLPGIRTATLHLWPAGGLTPTEADFEFWEVVDRVGFPISIHIALGGGESAELASTGRKVGENFQPINGTMSRPGGLAGYCMSQMITSRLFDRFPELTVAYAETGIGWIPFYAEQADSFFDRHRWWNGAELDHPPSHYVRRHFKFGFQDEFFAMKILDDIGVENCIWGTDFPHSATDYPNSVPLIEKMRSSVSEDVARKIFSQNAADYYHVELPS